VVVMARGAGPIPAMSNGSGNGLHFQDLPAEYTAG